MEVREIIRNTLKLILSLDVNTNLINFIGNGMVGSGFLTEIRIETLNRPETSVHQHHQHQQHNRLNMLTLWMSGQQRVGRLGEVRTGRVCCHSRVGRVTNWDIPHTFSSLREREHPGSQQSQSAIKSDKILPVQTTIYRVICSNKYNMVTEGPETLGLLLLHCCYDLCWQRWRGQDWR